MFSKIIAVILSIFSFIATPFAPISEKSDLKSELAKGCKNLIRKNLDKFRLSPLQLYKRFLNNINKYNYSDYKNLKLLKDKTLSNIKVSKVDFEDLAALLYLKYKTTDGKDLLEIREEDISRTAIVEPAGNIKSPREVMIILSVLNEDTEE